MKKTKRESRASSVRTLSIVALALMIALGISVGARADEEDATGLLKAMSDYLTAQDALSFSYDATLEVVTEDAQKLALASSGTVTLDRPGKIHATRSGGFADVEMAFDGTTLTVFGKNLNLFTQIEVPGTVDHLVDELRVKYNRPLPAADLLVSNPFDVLMMDVVDVKDLGSGVIGGVECNFLAFRMAEVDWQIWIAQGEHPYPCRYSITSKLVNGGPQYTVQFSNWKTGAKVAAADFSFKNPTKAKKVALGDLEGTDELPEHFTIGESE